jgi:autotransporter-associated beta strand protein
LKAARRFLVPLFFWTLGIAVAQAQLRVVNWNTLQSPSAGAPAEIGEMELVLQAIGDQTRPGFSRTVDVLLLQEQATNFSTTDRILNLLNGTNGAGGYARGTLSPVGGVNDIMQTVIYRTNSVRLIAESQATTINTNSGGTRATMRYQFRPSGYDSAADFYVYNSHLRPSDTTADANRRGVEVSQLRTNADALGEGAHIIYVGDMNFYRTNDAGWIAFTGSGAGQAFDPVNAVGNWNNNSNFTSVHTQNPRTQMDDRFDFQLVTSEVLDGRGFSYVTDSYWAFGNTGNHVFNQPINSGDAVAGLNAVLTHYSTAQISNVFSALISLADHLPVVADYQLPARLGVTTNDLASRVIVGAVLSNSFSVSNSAPVSVSNGADRLDYAFSGSGQVSATGVGTNWALTSANNHSFTFSAGSAGTNTGALVVSASSPQAANANLTNHFSVEALHRAAPSFASNANTISLEIDLGTLNFGDSSAAQSFDIFNRAGALGSAWTARLDLDGITAGVPTGIFSTTLSPFANLNAGSAASYQISLASGALGDFGGTYTLNLSDENLPGAGSHSLTLNVRGEVLGNVSVGPGQTRTESNTIAGAGSLVKQGQGTLTLAANNSYTGDTIVSSGTLALAVGATLGASNLIRVAAGAKLDVSARSVGLTVVSSQTLAGSGTIEGDLRIDGTIAPGSSPGMLTITNGNHTWAAGGGYDWQILDIDDGPGLGWDFIDITNGSLLFSGLSLATPFTINIFSLAGLPDTQGVLAGFNPLADYAWSILSAANPISGFNAAHFTLNTTAFTTYNSLNGGLFSLEARDNELFLVYDGVGGAAVPEPGTWLVGALLLAAAAVSLRRRLSSSAPAV